MRVIKFLLCCLALAIALLALSMLGQPVALGVVRTNGVMELVAIRYPAGATNFHNWEVQESHDLIRWTPIWHTIYSGFICVWPTNSPTYWRVIGRA